MAIPTYDELISPVLKLLSDGVERSGEDITNTIANQLNLTEEERSRIYANNPKKFLKIELLGQEHI